MKVLETKSLVRQLIKDDIILEGDLREWGDVEGGVSQRYFNGDFEIELTNDYTLVVQVEVTELITKGVFDFDLPDEDDLQSREESIQSIELQDNERNPLGLTLSEIDYIASKIYMSDIN